MRSGHTFLLFIFLLVSGILSAQNDVDADIQKLEKFLKNLDKSYVDQVETKPIVEDGIRRMLEELDPHSIYLDADAYARSNEPLKGKFKGLGVRFLMIDDTMTILDVIPGGSAESAGLQTGDQIWVINGDSISGKGFSSGKVARTIKEGDNDDLNLFIKRFRSKEPTAIAVKRSMVEVSSVPAHFMLDDRVGYIKLERFSASSLSDFRTAMDELKEEKLRDLVIDLRGNGGGYLNVAIKIVDEFLDDRKLIVYTEGEHQPKRETFATSGGRYTDGNLYVLIDANSASASEIFAGAVQDWDRGLIIGRRSYGKGLVQRTVEFDDGSAMRLTISRYYTPTGRSIQRPYENGIDAYRREIGERVESGELYSLDSIFLPDSLVYFTPLNRKVYGGGGIVPDVFVPMDTTLSYDSLRQARRKALFEGFALSLLKREEEKLLLAHRDVSSFMTGYKLSDEVAAQFGYFAHAHGVDLSVGVLESNQTQIEELIKVPLARYLYGYEAYFQALAYYDDDVKATLSEIEKGTFKELGLR